jgi:hypothetical protein
MRMRMMSALMIGMSRMITILKIGMMMPTGNAIGITMLGMSTSTTSRLMMTAMATMAMTTRIMTTTTEIP